MKAKVTSFNKAMAQQLKTMRLDAKLTMRQLGTKLNVPHSFVGKIEREGRRVDVGEFVIYCEAMGYDPLSTLKKLMKS